MARLSPEAAERITTIGFAIDRAVQVAEPAASRHAPDHDNLALARRIVKTRTARKRHFAAAMFGEPCWDMLLDLYVARVLRTSVSITSASIASQVPPTTALRHIAILRDHGYVVRAPDPFDARRTHLTLSDSGFQAMDRWLDTVREIDGVPPA